MVATLEPPISSYPCSVDEAQVLVRQCAEPRPAGDMVKAAIRRASRRLGLPFSRARDIWYGDARRIDAEEMDKLRQEAEKAALAQAIVAIEFLKSKLLTTPALGSQEMITNLDAALLACHSDAAKNSPTSGIR